MTEYIADTAAEEDENTHAHGNDDERDDASFLDEQEDIENEDDALSDEEREEVDFADIVKKTEQHGSADAFNLLLRQAGRYKLLSKDEFLVLFKRYKENNDREAFDLLVLSNIRLVIKMAKRFSNLGVPMSDIVSDGIFGLFRALELFEPEKGFHFSTYAVNWIRQHIIRSLYNTRRTVRIPTHMEQLRYRYIKILREADSRNEKVSDESLCEQLEISPKQLHHIRILFRPVVSGQLRQGEDGEGPTLEEQLSNETDDLNETGVLKPAVKMDLKVAMAKTLTDREISVVRMRYGFDAEPMTLEQIGEIIGVTRERIRQIEEQAMKKLHRFFSLNGELKEDLLSNLG